MHQIYVAAKDFLIRELDQPDAADIVESYLTPPSKRNELTIEQLFMRMLVSAQNANMKAGVVGKSIGGIEQLGRALFNFNPSQVSAMFSGNPEGLLSHIVTTLEPRGKIRTDSRSIWPKYCKTILSAAEFFLQFRDGEEFYAWANHLYEDNRSIAALPLVIAAEVDGIGYPLACDFLKELGFVSYGKPDVHIVNIFSGLGLCSKRAHPYRVQRTITQMAVSAGVSAYAVDKVFWLIGSGNFYNHPHLANGWRVRSRKERFLDAYRRRLASNNHDP